jgi:hypothetical protein
MSLHAAWVPFTITSLNPGQSAIGFEQIFRVPGTGAGGNGLGPNGGFDYAYLVANTGAAAIDGFLFDVGVANTRAAVAAFVAASPVALDTFTAPGGGDPGLFPNVVVGGPRPTPNINGELGPMNPVGVGFGPVNPINGPGVNPLPPLQGVLQQWGFEQFWNAGLTAYLARWYSNTPLDGVGPLPPRFYTRFDVFSPNGPVPGGGGVDPFDPGNFIAIDDGLGNLSDLITSPAVTPCDPTVSGSCDTTMPTGLAGFGPVGPRSTVNGAVPEPVPMFLMGGGLVMLSLVRRRRA